MDNNIPSVLPPGEYEARWLDGGYPQRMEITSGPFKGRVVLSHYAPDRIKEEETLLIPGTKIRIVLRVAKA